MKSLEQKQEESQKLFKANMKVLKMVFEFNEIAKVEWKGNGKAEYFPHKITFEGGKMTCFYKGSLALYGSGKSSELRFMDYGKDFSRFLYLLQHDLYNIHIGQEPAYGFYFTFNNK